MYADNLYLNLFLFVLFFSILCWIYDETLFPVSLEETQEETEDQLQSTPLPQLVLAPEVYPDLEVETEVILSPHSESLLELEIDAESPISDAFFPSKESRVIKAIISSEETELQPKITVPSLSWEAITQDFVSEPILLEIPTETPVDESELPLEASLIQQEAGSTFVEADLSLDSLISQQELESIIGESELPLETTIISEEVLPELLVSETSTIQAEFKSDLEISDSRHLQEQETSDLGVSSPLILEKGDSELPLETTIISEEVLPELLVSETSTIQAEFKSDLEISDSRHLQEQETSDLGVSSPVFTETNDEFTDAIVQKEEVIATPSDLSTQIEETPRNYYFNLPPMDGVAFPQSGTD